LFVALEGTPVMSGSNSDKMVTVSAQLSADSQVAEAFEQYRDVNAMNSKSEAVRQLLRVGLAEQMDDRGQDRTGDAESNDTAATIDIDLIRGNEPIILSAAFLVGSDNLLAALTAMAGTVGSWLFGLLGLLLLAWLFIYFVTNVELELGDGLRTKRTGSE